MFKLSTKRTQSPHSSSQPILPSNSHLAPAQPSIHSSSKIDLRKFNQYLQDRIRQKGLKKCTQRTLRQDDGIIQQTSPNLHMNMNKEDNGRKDRPVQKNRESPSQRRELLSGKGSWKKHESIDKLLQRQVKIINDQSRYLAQYQSNESTLCQLERKYQQLQDKYKSLMLQAISSAKQFESDKSQLKQAKDQQIEDRSILAELRQQLLSLQNLVNNKPNPKCKLEQCINLENSVFHNEIAALQVQQMWRNRQRDERETRKQLQMGPNRSNRTCQAWLDKNQKSSVCQSEKRANRNFSAERMLESSRKGGNKKSGDCMEINLNSKGAIGPMESLRGSKVRALAKQMPKDQPQTLKIITPTTLHKKMINSNLYSKYRFQPSVRLP